MSVIETRAYQARAIEAGRESFRKGHRAVLFVGPTGCGKTTIFSLMAKGRADKGGRVVVFAHRTELVEQAAARLRSFGLEVGCNGAGANAPLQVVSAQTCLSRRTIPEANLGIFDEAHHYVAPGWNTIPTALAAARVPIVGFSATPERADGIGLGEVFDDLVIVAQIAELTALGFLVPCDIVDPVAQVKALAMEPFEAVARFSDGRSTVVFAPHIKAAHKFADDIHRSGVSVGVVHSPVKECDRGCADRRAETLARFAAGELRVIVNVNVLTEGWDCPRAKVAILARRYGSASQYLQAVGRVLRPDDSGYNARLVDLAGNVELHGPPSEERIYSLTGAAVSRFGDVRPDGVRICRSCKAEIPPEAGRCERCGRMAPELATPIGEGVEMRITKAEAARRARLEAPESPHTKALGTLYMNALRKGHKRTSAEFKYSLNGRRRPPSTQMKAEAWNWATMMVAREKHDAWEPPT